MIGYGKIRVRGHSPPPLPLSSLFDRWRLSYPRQLKARQADLRHYLRNGRRRHCALLPDLRRCDGSFAAGAAILTLAGRRHLRPVAWHADRFLCIGDWREPCFLSSRYILRDWVKARFAKRVEAIDRGIERMRLSIC
jgi:hypothetical protein